MKEPVNIFWFRRDLRLEDNAGLFHALKAHRAVLPVFIFDRNILDRLERGTDRRVEFIHRSLESLSARLKRQGSSIRTLYDFPEKAFTQLLQEYDVEEVFTNHDYEPYSRDRDRRVGALLTAAGIKFHTFKDQVIFDREEIMKDSGEPYTVYTPYSKKWKQSLTDFYTHSYETGSHVERFCKHPAENTPSLEQMGFSASGLPFPPSEITEDMIGNYDQRRDYPALDATSHLGVHLRFGTVSIRGLVRRVINRSPQFLDELIWREFFQMILWHFPQVGMGKSFKPAYDHIQWRHNEKDFERWCKGMTGYPIVDAGMRQLNETGYMHNRIRMITASFLCKHLLLDWRWGEAYFAGKLLDFDLAANNGNWQWVAGTGCDAAPYFRIFNPTLQAKKFDPSLAYIKKWVPELSNFAYPAPMVDHEMARERCLNAYKKALKEAADH